MDQIFPEQPPPTSSGAAGPVSAPASAPRARIGIVVLTAVVLELVIVAAAANQWMTDRLVRRAQSASPTVRAYELSWLTYQWRFSPRSGQSTEQFAGQLLLVPTLLLVSALLIWCLLRGPVTFARAFFGTWLSVVAATLVAAFVRGLLDPDNRTPAGTDRVTRAVFGASGPGPSAVLAGAALGFVVALIVALVAIATRRSGRRAAEPAAYAQRDFADYGPPPEQPPPYYGAPGAGGRPAGPPWQDQRYGPPPGVSAPPAPSDEQRTTVLPSLPPSLQKDEPPAGADQATTRLPAAEPPRTEPPAEADQATTQLPPAQPPQAEPPQAEPPQAEPPQAGPTAPPAADQPTTQFPRPPDDEDLHHIDHDPGRA